MALPSQVMYEALATAIADLTVTHAVFTTFSFEPEQFELDILPVLFEIPLRAAPRVRRAQLEEALSAMSGGVSVFYDPHALRNEAAVLDIARVPIRVKRGVFHPKLSLLLCRDINGLQKLVCLVASANLTQAGWQTNLEAAHLFTFEPGAAHHCAAPLHRFLGWLSGRARLYPQAQDHVRAIREFLADCPAPGQRRKNGRVLDQLWVGGVSGRGDGLASWLADRVASGGTVEVVSPFLDTNAAAAQDLIKELHPATLRLAAPGDRTDGELEAHAACDGLRWGELKAGILGREGSSRDAAERRVHAKLVRAFKPGGPDLVAVGSANLTTAAWSGRNNVEVMVLTAQPDSARPSAWLSSAGTPLATAQGSADTSEPLMNNPIPVAIIYDWVAQRLEMEWLEQLPVPRLTLVGKGVELCSIPGGTKPHPPQGAGLDLLRVHLATSVVVTVRTEWGEEGWVIIGEAHREARPSTLLTLTPAEILEFWATLSPERRAAMIEDFAGPFGLAGLDGAADTDISPVRQEVDVDSFFARTAGTFHGFSRFERSVREAIEERGIFDTRATALVFGEKFDSLGVYVDRLLPSAKPSGADMDDIERLIHLMCARQVVDALRGDFPEFWQANPVTAKRLRARIHQGDLILEAVSTANPDLAEFILWWQAQFLHRETAEVR